MSVCQGTEREGDGRCRAILLSTSNTQVGFIIIKHLLLTYLTLRLAVEMMRTYNTTSAIVFNTQQCYLKKALKTVTLDLEQARRQGFYYGAKLVRGAYMEQERARAQLLGYKDPINADYEATSAMYHSVLDECLTRIKALKDAGDDPQKIGIMVASHNADTVRYGVAR